MVFNFNIVSFALVTPQSRQPPPSAEQRHSLSQLELEWELIQDWFVKHI